MFHEYTYAGCPPNPEAMIVVLSPGQISGGGGVIITPICVFSVTVTHELVIQPPPSVTVTQWLPAPTVIVAVVSPVFHK